MSEDLIVEEDNIFDLSKIMSNRGIDYGNLKSERLDDLSWRELDDAVEKVKEYLLEVKRVGVLYDVDVDGLASGRIIEKEMSRYGLIVYRFMNKRKKHGISKESIEWVKKEGVELLFVVDAGTNDIEGQRILSEMGVKVVVLDHHPVTVLEEIENVDIVNCSIRDELPELSGAGVCFRFVEKLGKEIRGGDGNVSHHEPWVGLSVLSDHCSMIDNENRYYVSTLYNDFSDINLFNAFKFWGSRRTLFTFGVIPFLNACIRINRVDWAMDAVNMGDKLNTKKFVESKREMVIAEQKGIIERMKEKSLVQFGKEIVLMKMDASDIEYSGMSGLLANKILNEVKKSVIVFYDEGDGYFRGSFRGYGGMIDEHLRSVGLTVRGHPMAAGIELRKEDAGVVFGKIKELEVGDKEPEFDFELSEREVKKNWDKIVEIARFNEMTGGELDLVMFRLTDVGRPFVELYGKKKEYVFKDFSVRDFDLSRGVRGEWILEPIMNLGEVVLLRR